MTGQLRTSLHTRADDLATWDVDLDIIVRNGTRRVRRRRAALAAGVAGVLAVVGGAALASREHRTTSTPVDQPTIPLSYAVGSVIHDGDTRIDVGVSMASLVRTARGFVFADHRQRVYEEKNGDVRRVRDVDGSLGRLADPSSPLVVGDDGLVAAWWDGKSIQTWPGVKGNTNSISVAQSWPGDTPPSIRAIAGGHLWFWDGRHTAVAEVRPTPTTAVWVDSGFPGAETVQSAAGDRTLVRVGDGLAVVQANLRPLDVAGLRGWRPGTDLSGIDAQVPHVTSGELSPDGRHWFTRDGGQVAVFDSATGQRQDPAYPGFASLVPYEWLSDDAIAAFGSRTDDATGSLSLLTCRVSTNACTVTAADVGPAGDVVVADGLPAARR